jgi:hypothetical protein
MKNVASKAFEIVLAVAWQATAKVIIFIGNLFFKVEIDAIYLHGIATHALMMTG